MKFELKCDPQPFQAMWDGLKRFEVRADDRVRPGEGMGYAVGDELVLRETVYTAKEMQDGQLTKVPYTGREMLGTVKRKITGYGLQDGVCAMDIEVTGKANQGANTKAHIGDRVWTLPCFWREPSNDEPKVTTSVRTRDPLYKPSSEGDQYIGTKITELETHTHTGGVTQEKTRPVAAWEKLADTPQRKFGHYYRPCPYDGIDVYRVLEIFNVISPPIQHAIKKLLVPGRRGTKDVRKDLSEAVVSINRAIEMMDEDAK